MRSAILAHLNAGGIGLDPDVMKAIEALKTRGSSEQAGSDFLTDRTHPAL